MVKTDPPVKQHAGPVHEMTQPEIDQFLACARIGRIGMILEEGPYIVPLGYCYSEGKVFFHTCQEGIKMEALRSNPNVCFEVDESLSDTSLAKSVIILGEVRMIKEKELMIPYLQKLIDKYRVPVPFGEYMSRENRKMKEELENVTVWLIIPKKMTGRTLVRTNSNF